MDTRTRRSQPVDLPGIRPVLLPRVSDEVAEQIRRLIVSEQLAEGARLPAERELADRFEVSRPMVSQALRMLSLMGLIEIRRGSGAFVLRRPQAEHSQVGIDPALSDGNPRGQPQVAGRPFAQACPSLAQRDDPRRPRRQRGGEATGDEAGRVCRFPHGHPVGEDSLHKLPGPSRSWKPRSVARPRRAAPPSAPC